MRKQVRPPEPVVLAENREKWTQQWIELRSRNSSASFVWHQVDRKSAREWLLPHLDEMTHGHCSFCDSYPLSDRSNTPIEHFRPKSDPRFESHAYLWTNLYFCCESCQGHKRDQWHDDLLCPDAADYEFSNYFAFDFTTGEIKPNPVATEYDRERAKITITLYGLDSPARRRFRREELFKWQRFRDVDLDQFGYRDFLETST